MKGCDLPEMPIYLCLASLAPPFWLSVRPAVDFVIDCPAVWHGGTKAHFISVEG